MAVHEQILMGIRGAKRLYAQLLEPALKQYGVTQPQADVLLFLRNNPNRDTAQEICETRGLAKSNASNAIDALAARGWIARQRDEKNRRLVRLQLRPAAEPFLRDTLAAQVRFYERLTRGLSPEELASARTIFLKIAENLENC